MSTKFKKYFNYLPVLVALFSAIFVYWLLNFYTTAELQRQTRANKEVLHRQLDQSRSVIEQKISGQIDVSRSLADYVEFNPKIDQKIFSSWASKVFIKSNAQALTFELTKKDSLTFYFPKKGNVLLTIALKPAKKEITIQEIEKSEKVILFIKESSQRKLNALVYQNLIYTLDTASSKRNYWGSAVIVDDLDATVKSVFKANSDSSNYTLEILLGNENEALFLGKTMDVDYLVVSETFQVRNLSLKLSLGSKKLNQDLIQSRRELRVLFICLALLVAFLNGYILRNMFQMKRTNKVLALKNKSIKVQLQEKVLLIKEIHHRIKNHFQLISSLNRTSGERLKNKTSDEIIEDINNRIELLAKAYDRISGANQVNNYIPEYFPSVVDSLINGLLDKPEVIYKIDPIYISIKRTVYLGIMMNEMVTNSIKHAFNDDRNNNRIQITFIKKEGKFLFQYLSNGKDLPNNVLEEFENSTGIQLLKMFAQQLDGTIEQIEENEFTGYDITFPA